MTTQRYIGITAQHSNTRGKGKRLRQENTHQEHRRGEPSVRPECLQRSISQGTGSWTAQSAGKSFAASVLGDTVTQALCAAVLLILRSIKHLHMLLLSKCVCPLPQDGCRDAHILQCCPSKGRADLCTSPDYCHHYQWQV